MNNLWDFAVGIYQHAPIKSACLRLQDTAGADVCVLLAVVWLGKNGRQLTLAEIALLVSTVETWQQKMTLPLRRLRKEVRQFIDNEPSLDAEPIYQQIKAAEMEAERVTLQQLQVFTDTQHWHSGLAVKTDNAAVVMANISLYLSQCQPLAKTNQAQQWEEVSALFVQY
ncbi:MAG: TIGR02444 family protein [Cellvibrionales bacterium]|jgi:uncharacterized protein (TIGR02444 family)|nr:TIGR02444 family protein [Cellvibrionales bacterium]MBT5922518.1 TIGR02444 family protein [Cellvibrionales bacterium]MBT6580164.1 TIGR02444 family protein [Cellvibrionales bacterium]